MSDKKKNFNIESLSIEDVAQVMNLGHQLRDAIERQDTATIEKLTTQKEALLDLLAFIMQNLDNPNLDPELFAVLLRFFGINPEKEKKKFKERKKQNPEQEVENKEQYGEPELNDPSMPKEMKQFLFKMICYEVYKVLNPHQLAGETEMENFLSNVKTRGLESAMKYEGHDYAEKFSLDDLVALGSDRAAFVKGLASQGHFGGGLGGGRSV